MKTLPKRASVFAGDLTSFFSSSLNILLSSLKKPFFQVWSFPIMRSLDISNQVYIVPQTSLHCPTTKSVWLPPLPGTGKTPSELSVHVGAKTTKCSTNMDSSGAILSPALRHSQPASKASSYSEKNTVELTSSLSGVILLLGEEWSF